MLLCFVLFDEMIDPKDPFVVLPPHRRRAESVHPRFKAKKKLQRAINDARRGSCDIPE